MVIITISFICVPFLLRCMEYEVCTCTLISADVYVLLLFRNGVNLKSSSGLYSHRSVFETASYWFEPLNRWYRNRSLKSAD